MVVDNEWRMDLGPFRDSPFFTYQIAAILSLYGKHLGSAVIASGNEEKSIADLGHKGDRNPVIVMGGLPKGLSISGSLAGNKALLAALIYYRSQDDMLFPFNLQEGWRGV